MKLSKTITSIVTTIILLYVLLLVYAHFFSDSLIFFPPTPGYRNSAELVTLSILNGNRISAHYLKHEKSRYTILISHGNAEDLGSMGPFLHAVREHGFSVLCYDYPGYGLSYGVPTEHGSYHASIAAYSYLTEQLGIHSSTIIVYGYSLGAAMALNLAVSRPVAAVILQGGFVSAFRVVTRFSVIPFDKFNNLTKIAMLSVPLLVIHGTNDLTVPFWHGKKIYDSYAGRKELYIVNGAGHNDLIGLAGEEYWARIETFIVNNLTEA